MAVYKLEVYLVWCQTDDGMKFVLAAYANRESAENHIERATRTDWRTENPGASPAKMFGIRTMWIEDLPVRDFDPGM